MWGTCGGAVEPAWYAAAEVKKTKIYVKKRETYCFYIVTAVVTNSTDIANFKGHNKGAAIILILMIAE